MLNFDFSEKVHETVSPAELVHDFSCFFICLLKYSVNWPNFRAWLPLLLEMWYVYVSMAIVCSPGCGAINLIVTLSFCSSGFYTWPKIKTKI